MPQNATQQHALDHISIRIPVSEDFLKTGYEKEKLAKLIFESPAYKNLFSLQVQQYHHDKRYHWDIQILPMHQRINHMVLHFAKYVGRLTEASLLEDSKMFQQAIIDCCVISLATANMLNINLSQEIQKTLSSNDCDFVKTADGLSNKYQLSIDEPLFTIKFMAIYTGRMAKAAESIDHLEKYPFREILSECVAYICIQAMIAASISGIELDQAIPERLNMIRKNYIFHSVLDEK